MRWASLGWGGVVLFVLFIRPAAGQPPVPDKQPDFTGDDEKTLRAVGLTVDGPALLDYFKKHTFKEADPKKVSALIKDLADDDFAVREKAYAGLLALGSGALGEIKEAVKNPNTEASRRAAELRQAIEAKAEPGIQVACARQVARLKPAGASDVLLAYLPFADPNVLDDLGKALAAVGVKDGKAEPGLVNALSDRLALKRGVAGQALAQDADQRTAVRKLLKDPDASVRLRVALALVYAKDKEALPALIDVLAELPPEQLWPAEEVLVRLAADKTPGVSLGNNETTRKACRDAWAAWLDQNKSKIDLAKLTAGPPHLGYTLLVYQKVVFGRGTSGEIVELDAARKPRWQFEVTNTYPVHAQIVGPGRVLVTEYSGQRVSERDFKGDIKWQKQVPGNPISAQRLANGNTFVATQNSLLEYNLKGDEVFNHQGGFIYRARKAANGDIVYVTNTGQVVRLDSKTKQEIKSFSVGNTVTVLGNQVFGSIDILPNGHILLPHHQSRQVVEYDRDGKRVGTPIRLQQFPTSAMRLPNGHTLVGSANNSQVAEYDRSGRQLWVYNAGGQVFNASGR
jgi:outer membrane protein assembly factor BamB